MSKRFRLIAVGVAVLCVALVAWNFLAPMLFFFLGGGGKQFIRPPVTISASPITKGPWTPVIDAVGTARAAQGSDLAAQVAGIVKAINFQSNQRVSANQVLVQIDDSVEQATMAGSQANIRLYAAQLTRASKLRSTGFIAPATIETAQNSLEVARSDLARTQATADLKAIKAPFDGVVGIARVNVGQYVAVGTPITTLQDLDHMKVDFTVPEQVASVLTPGLVVHLGATPDKLDFTAHVVGVDPKVDPDTRLVNVQALLDNPDGKISPGQFLRIEVELPAQSNVLQLPQTAVVPSLYGDSVYVAAAPEAAKPGDKGPPPAAGSLVAKQVFVKTGRRVGAKVEVVSGLNEGDVVVWAGQNKLQNGAAVVIDNSIDPAKVASEGQGKYR